MHGVICIHVYISCMYLCIYMCRLSHEIDQSCSLVDYSMLVFRIKPQSSKFTCAEFDAAC